MTVLISFILCHLAFEVASQQQTYSCNEFTLALNKWAISGSKQEMCKELSLDAGDAFAAGCRVYFVNREKFDQAISICKDDNNALKAVMDVDIMAKEKEQSNMMNLTQKTSADKENSGSVVEANLLILMFLVLFTFLKIWH